MDLMKIGSFHILQIFTSDTYFSAAEILDSLNTDEVWNALLRCWVVIYAGMKDVLFMDNGSVFTENEWKNLRDENGRSRNNLIPN